jgi:hypothetical protein
MDPALVAIFEAVAKQGLSAAILFLAVYYLSRTLKTQYEGRISSLEARSRECEMDRLELGREMRAMQSERIGLLEQMLQHREGE